MTQHKMEQTQIDDFKGTAFGDLTVKLADDVNAALRRYAGLCNTPNLNIKTEHVIAAILSVLSKNMTLAEQAAKTPGLAMAYLESSTQYFKMVEEEETATQEAVS